MNTIKTTEKELIRVNNLIRKIRITREEWCDLIDNEKLKEANSYNNISDIQIIIDALNGLLLDEEWKVKDLYKRRTKKMIKPTKYQNIICSLPEETIKDLENIAKDFGITRIGIIRLLLSEGIKTYYNYHQKGGV